MPYLVQKQATFLDQPPEYTVLEDPLSTLNRWLSRTAEQ